MSSRNPLGPVRDAAGTVEQTLRRAISAADEQWNDAARRAFDAQHLRQIQSEARQMTEGLADMAERLRAAASLLNTDP